RYGDRVYQAALPLRHQRRGVQRRAHAAVALRVFHRCASRSQNVAEKRAAAFAAHDEHALAGDVGELGAREQRLTVSAALRRDHATYAMALELASRASADRGHGN